jgi:hypothetical protein
LPPILAEFAWPRGMTAGAIWLAGPRQVRAVDGRVQARPPST